MRIAIFARSLPMHAGSGGMETQTNILAQGLVKKGHEVVVITNPLLRQGFGGQAPQSIYQVIITEKGDHSRYTKDYFRESVRLFQKLHTEKPFSIVISESAAGFGYATRLKEELKVPEIIIQHGTIWGEVVTLWQRAESLRDYLRFFVRILPFALKNYLLLDLPHFRRVDKIVAVSKDVEEQLVAQYFIPRKKIEVVYNGIDVDKFQISNPKLQPELREKLGFSESDVVLVYIGRVIKEKGLQDVVELMPRLPDFVHFLVVGEGDYIKDLRIKNEKLRGEGRVKFVGKVGYDEVSDYYNVGDIFVFPTHRREGFPMTLVEAQAAGLPVVVAEGGGSAEAIVANETGFSYLPGDMEALYAKLLELIDSPPLRQEMSHNARRRAETSFRVETMVENTLNVLSEFA